MKDRFFLFYSKTPFRAYTYSESNSRVVLWAGIEVYLSRNYQSGLTVNPHRSLCVSSSSWAHLASFKSN